MRQPRIRGLTLWRPWGWAIAYAGKDVENRKWEPPANVVGTWLAIHCGKQYDREAAEMLRAELPSPLAWQVPTPEQDAPGVIIAVARLKDVVRGSRSPWFSGPVGWELADVTALPRPIACKGAQGLWTLPDDVLLRVRAAWVEARATTSSR